MEEKIKSNLAQEVKVSTKERIIAESLKLFAGKGYAGVSMREIAAAVGIKGASIYNHFKGKEEIFQGIFDEMTKRYASAATMLQIPEQDAPGAASVYHNIEETKLLTMAEGVFDFFTKDTFAVLFRKLLVSEQNRSELAAKYYKDYYLEAPITFQSELFKELQKAGEFEGYDPAIMALHFYGPMFFVINQFDRGMSYEECLVLVKKHVHYFCKLYQAQSEKR